MVATKKEFLASLREEPAKHDRMVILPRLIVGLLFGLFLVSLVAQAYAEPIAQLVQGNVTITVYNEPCTHQDSITNAPVRATWKEGDKVFDGCAGVVSQIGMAYFWFTDKTVAVVPLQMFSKLTGA